jgi:uncharacterized protein YdaU (DUF1376 family)
MKINLDITFDEALTYFDNDISLMRVKLGNVARQAIYKWKADNRLPPKRVIELQQYIFENERDHMQFYYHHIGDFMKSTHFLTHEDRSIYLGMLWHYYDTEKPLTKNVSELAMRMKATEDQITKLLEVFFVESEDGYVNSRVEQELEKTYQKSQKARENVMKRWNKKYDSNTNDILPSTQDPVPKTQKRDSSSEMNEIDQSFDEFWDAWPSSKRKVDRRKCYARWKSQKLHKIARMIIDHVEAMKLDEDWIDGFVPLPFTYLNQKRWEAGLGSTKTQAKKINPMLKEDRSNG